MEDGEIAPDSVDASATHTHLSTLRTSLANNEPLEERSPQVVSGAIYSPAIEWPGDPDLVPLPAQSLDAFSSTHAVHPYPPLNALDPHARKSTSTTLRLIVQTSSILPKEQTLVVVDGYTEVQFGRDHPLPGSNTPRLRLKEMEVSKLHATVYWDTEREEWAVVDMGSKHGTFLRSLSAGTVAGAAGSTDTRSSHIARISDLEKGVRLSQPRMASVPRKLRHLDCLSIGSTTFVLHLHEDAVPCTECSRQNDNDIPLFNRRDAGLSEAASKKRKLDTAESQPAHVPKAERDPKRALSNLKRNLLSRHGTPGAAESSSQYLDRSARRRGLFRDVPEPSLQPSNIASSSSRPSSDSHFLPPSMVTAPMSTPPTHLPESNIGHRLLMKQGWAPGTSLGQADSRDVALIEPLDVIGNVGRVGLGMSNSGGGVVSTPSSQSSDWKEEGRRRRWAGLQSHQGG